MPRYPLFVGSLCLALALPVTASVVSVGSYTPSATNPFVVPVVISDATGLGAFTFDLNYNAADYRINTSCDAFSGDAFCDFVTGPVTLGTFYTDAATFAPLFNPGFVLLDTTGDQIGQLIGVNGAWQDPGPAPSGAGALAFVEFVGVEGGTLGSPITVGDSGSPATVPEPSSAALVFAGFAALGLGRLRRSANRSTRAVRPV